MCMSLITNIVVLYEVPNFFWFALLYYLLYNIVVWGGIWWPKATQPPAGLAIGPEGRQSLVYNNKLINPNSVFNSSPPNVAGVLETNLAVTRPALIWLTTVTVTKYGRLNQVCDVYD